MNAKDRQSLLNELSDLSRLIDNLINSANFIQNRIELMRLKVEHEDDA